MSKCISNSLLFAAIIFAIPGGAWAWGAIGHRIVAEVASDQLTPATRQQVQDLLSTDTMADVSSWADDERSRNRQTATWHYVDWEIENGKLLANSTGTGTILDALSTYTNVLKDHTADPRERKKALMYVIHFVGDMHQPLHCADNYDKGGNGVNVFLYGRQDNLHRAWDSTILEQVTRDEASQTSGSIKAFAQLIEKRYKDEATTAVRGTIEDWALESHRIACNVAYSYRSKDPLTSLTVTLGEDYLAAAKPTIERQLAIGGYRLAKVLNDCLGTAGQTSSSSANPARSSADVKP
jgi:hypothetical protein